MDFDGQYGAQCFDFFNFYYQFITGNNPYSDGYQVPNASDIFDVPNDRFTFVVNDPNNPSQLPPQLSVMLYDTALPGSDGAGHVVVVDSANTQQVTVWDQNWGGQTVHHQAHMWTGHERGWIVFNGFTSDTSAPVEVPVVAPVVETPVIAPEVVVTVPVVTDNVVTGVVPPTVVTMTTNSSHPAFSGGTNKINYRVIAEVTAPIILGLLSKTSYGKKIQIWFQGKKLHIISAVGAILNGWNFLNTTGLLTNLNIPHMAQINTILVALGGTALAAKLNRQNKAN